MTVGMAQCDRCSCRPAQQANKIIALICHLIPLSTELQSRNMHNMVIIYRHLQTLGLVGWEKISLCVFIGSWDHFKITADHVKMIALSNSWQVVILKVFCLI